MRHIAPRGIVRPRHAGRPSGSTKRLLFAVVGIVIGLLAATACSTGQPSIDSERPSVTSAASRLVAPEEFAAAMAEPDRITINVHVPFEGDIPGTDLSIPFDQIAAQADRLPADRSAKLAIYCRSGPMSATAAAALSDLGYMDIVELRGGMKAWQADNRPLIGI